MRIKTMAVLITEDTYPIAVACLPAGFASYPFGNVMGYWLIINDPVGYDRNSFDGDQLLPVVTVQNLWMHPNKFIDSYTIINKKPGKTAANAWIEIEKAVDEEMKKHLEGEEVEEDALRPAPYRRNTFARRPHYQGFRG